MAIMWGLSSLPMGATIAKKCGRLRGVWDLSSENGSAGCTFPSFLPKEVENIKDPYARTLAQRIERLPVDVLHMKYIIVSVLE